MVMLDTKLSLLNNLVGKKFTSDELHDVLFDLGMELDDVSGDDIKIDITSDRPDLVSPQGLARALRAYFTLQNPKYLAKTVDSKLNYKVIVDKSVSDVRPFTCCAIVKNLKFDDQKIKEIIWVQEKLHATFGRHRKKVAIGIYPLEHITLPIHFKADKPENIKFRPLEYDIDMTGNEILENHPTGKEYAHLLSGLKKYPFFSDAKGNILSMPPIINSNLTGRVTEKTTDVFIECSGHDFNALSQTLNILVYLFQDLGGEIYYMELEYPDKKITTPLLEKEKRKISTKFVNDTIGIKLSSKEIAENLKKMMHHVTHVDENGVEFEIEPVRTDIWHDIDIADDVVRAIGINSVKYEVPSVATTGNILPENRISSQITDIMVGLGFQEIVTFALTDENIQYKAMNIQTQEHIKLGRTAEQSINMVRTWLLPEMMKTFMANRNREFPQKLFEVNYIVEPDKDADVLSKNVLKMSCSISDSDVDFTKIKQVLVYLLDTLGVKNYVFQESKFETFIGGRSAEITVDGKKIGIIGEVHPQVLSNFDLVMPIGSFELNLSVLFNID